MKKGIIFFLILYSIFSCSVNKYININIFSSKENIVDSCKFYLPNYHIPSLEDWNYIKRNNGNIYYYIIPIYNKHKTKVISHKTIISKPFIYIMGRDSLVNGNLQYFTIIKNDLVE